MVGRSGECSQSGGARLFVSLDRAHKSGGMSTRAICYVVDITWPTWG
jgi:hypothetical protein